jgi:hypothetical protein
MPRHAKERDPQVPLHAGEADAIQVWGGDGEIPREEIERLAAEEQLVEERLTAAMHLKAESLKRRQEARRAQAARAKRMRTSQVIPCLRFQHHGSYVINQRSVITLTALLYQDQDIANIYPTEKRARLTFQYPGYRDPLKPLERPVIWTFINGSITCFKRITETDEADAECIMPSQPVYSFQIECDAIEHTL